MAGKFINKLRGIVNRKYFNKAYTQVAIPSFEEKLLVPNDLYWAYSSGDYYEHNVIHFLDIIIKNLDNPVLLDVGANCGYFTVRYAKQCKQVFSFEPVKSTFSILSKNVKRNSLRNVRVFKTALSSKAGKAEINLYNSSGNNSIFERIVPEGHSLKKTGTQTIKLDTLDNLIGRGEVLPPDIMKIDVEGAELFVLQGAKETILKHRPIILMEYSENTSNDAGYAKEELLTVLGLPNYAIYGIPEDENDFRLIKQADFHLNPVSNVIFIPSERNQVDSLVN